MIGKMRIALLPFLFLSAPLDSVHGSQETQAPPVTFTREIAPIVHARCAACHRPGEAGPFPLLEYGDLKKRSKQILEVVESRRMPPWKPVEGHGEFAGTRRMEPEEIATFKTWVEQGCIEGAAKDLPPVPKFPEGWALGEPDLVVTMAEPFTVPAEGPDLFRAFALPLGLTEDRYVRAVQFRPANRQVVHHAMLFLDPTPESRRKDETDPAPGFPGLTIGFGALVGGALATWTPGDVPKFFPDGMGREVKKGSDLVLQVHFNPIGKAVEEKVQVGLWFTKETPRQQMVSLPMYSTKIDLPAGDKDLQVRDRLILPVTVDLFGVIPHAHYLARECRMWAKDPEGKEIPVIWIKDWNFDWQETYRFKEMIRLPAGTEINMVWTYDNTSANPRNPSHPPVRVRFGMGSKDEMATAGVLVATSNPSDKLRLYFAVFSRQRER
jgi:hypothetical protein